MTEQVNPQTRFSLRKLGTSADEFIETGGCAQHEARHQKPRPRSQPPIQQPTKTQPGYDRTEKREGRGIGEARFAIDFFFAITL